MSATNLLRQQLLLIFSLISLHFLCSILKPSIFKIVEFYAEMLVFFAAIQILYRMLYKKASMLASEQYVYAVECGIYYALPPGYHLQHTKQLLIAAGSQWNCSGHSCHDPEDAIFFADLPGYMPESVSFFLRQSLLLARTSYGAKLSL
ncbi:MAG: hypothetical protein ACLRVD_00720 [Blautia caecimuris]